MSATIPFPAPHILTARLKMGFVDVSIHGSDDDGVSSGVTSRRVRGWDSAGIEGASCAAAGAMPQSSSLEHNETTMSKRIIEIETKSGSTTREINADDNAKPTIVAFWLQRKLGHESSSRNLVVRLGYRLRRIQKVQNEVSTLNIGINGDVNSSEYNQDNCEWKLDRDGMGQLILVRVHILQNIIVAMHQSQSPSMDLNSPLNELSALQMIARQNHSSSSQMSPLTAHVVGTNLIATDEENSNIYTILPYHRDGTLLQFCQSIGSLEESLARFIFRQIIQGLKTLKDSGMCHRNISLDTIAMDGDHVDIIGLGWALQCNKSKAVSQDANGDDKSRYFPPTSGCSDPRFIAPESFHYQSSSNKDSGGTTDGADRVWNGFSDDLWATGLILYSMVVGTDALFTLPISGNKIFTRLCIKGDIRGEAERSGNLLSDDLVILLQSMLNADPKQRSVLEHVMVHPWVTNDEPAITPTKCTELHRIAP